MTSKENKYRVQMFIDYDHCHDKKTDTDKYCRNCTIEQRLQCKERIDKEGR